MLSSEGFSDFVAAVHSPGAAASARRTPFPWQLALLDRVERDGWGWLPPVDAPTGLGKTSVLDVAVYAAAMQAQRGGQPPRRYFLVVDRRIVVDEAYDHAMRVSEALRNAPSGSLVMEVAEALRRLTRGRAEPLAVTRMRGGVTWDWRWVTRPDQLAIVTGTVDQVGSRLFFRGYGVSERRYSLDAALVGTDSVIFVDEAHLAEPMLRTIAAARALDVPRRRVRPPAAVVTLSATHTDSSATQVGQGVFDLAANLAHPLAARRLRAAKRMVTATCPAPKLSAVLAAAAGQALAARPGGLVAVVANTVNTAREVFDAASRRTDVDAVLLTGRSRPLEREVLLDEWLRRLTVGWRDTPERTRLLVATQTVEVGANLDIDILITESAPWSNLVQRIGRVNRVGDAEDGLCVVVHPDSATPPVYGALTTEAWGWLSGRQGPASWPSPKAVDAGWVQDTGNGLGLDVSPLAVTRLLSADEAPLRSTPTVPAPVLIRQHLDCWARTGPVPEPDVPVDPFLHGFDGQQAPVRLVWRADLSAAELERMRDSEAGQWPPIVRQRLAALPPRHEETLEVPLRAARAWLRGDPMSEVTDDDGGALPTARERATHRRELPALAVRALDDDAGLAVRSPQALRPGDLLVVPSTYGGCDRYGWAPNSRAPVLDLGDLCSVRQGGRGRRPAAALRLSPGTIVPLVRAVLGRTARDAASDELVADLQDRLTALAEERRNGGEDVRERPWVEPLEGPEQQLASVVELLDRAGDVMDTAANWGRRWAALWERVGAARPGQRGDRVGRVVVPEATEGGTLLLVPEGRSTQWADDTGSAASSVVGQRQSLDDHQAEVAHLAHQIATNLGLPELIRQTVRYAAARHDMGKLDPRFQALLSFGSGPPAAPLAKSGMPAQSVRLRRQATDASGYPSGGRHEALSNTLVQDELARAADHGIDTDLAVHLVASHHGHARPLLPPVPDPDGPGSIEFDGRAVATRNGEVDWSSPPRFALLNERYGRWGVGLLEAVVRLADIACSAGESDGRDEDAVKPLPPVRATVLVESARTGKPIPLPALQATSPLGFIASLGVLNLVRQRFPVAGLSWDPESGCAVVHSSGLSSVEDLVDMLWEIRSGLAEGQFWPEGPVGFPPPREAPDPLIVARERFAELLDDYADARDVVTGLVTDLAVNDKGLVRRTPFVAPTGKQSFYTMARNQHQATARREALREAVLGWRRVSGVPAEGFDRAAIWNAADAPDGKPVERSVPGATWLAIQALPGLRLAGDTRRSSATAWRRAGRAVLVWPLWRPALPWEGVLALLEHPQLSVVGDEDGLSVSLRALAPLGVWRVCAAQRRPTANSDGPLVPVPVSAQSRPRAQRAFTTRTRRSA